jgi:S-DNA-T family DNA segregation ATPase FtsK/SpoIIIE
MPATDRSLDIVAFVSEHFRDILRRRVRELAGLAFLTLALLGAIALATWSVQDPSLSHATQKPIRNLLGLPGAIFSDLAMQLLGLASMLLLVPEALLGWRLLSHRAVGEKWRGLIWILATFLATAFASTLPRTGSWPLPTGLGGVFGDALLNVPAFMTGGQVSGVALFATSAVLGMATLLTLAIAAGLRWPRAGAVEPVMRDAEFADEIEDEAEDDNVSAWRGMITHALLSAKARVARLFKRTPRTPLPVARASGARMEPRFDSQGHAL